MGLRNILMLPVVAIMLFGCSDKENEPTAPEQEQTEQTDNKVTDWEEIVVDENDYSTSK